MTDRPPPIERARGWARQRAERLAATLRPVTRFMGPAGVVLGGAATQVASGTRVLRAETGPALSEVRRSWGPRAWAAVGVAVVVAAVPLVVTDPLDRASLASVLYVALAAVGLNVAVGLAGLPSLAQGAFVGIGAFGVALLRSRAGWDPTAAVIVGTVASAAGGLVIGWAAARLRETFVAVATWLASWAFAFALAAFPGLFGGSQGLVVPEGRAAIPWTGVAIRLTPGVQYEIAVALVAVSLAAVATIARRPTGLALATVRKSSAMSERLGLSGRRLQLGAFAVSAAVGGLAGGMAVQLAGVADPTVYGPLLSVELFVAVLLGGAGTVTGPLLGAVVLSILPSAARGLGSASGAGRFEPLFASVLLIAALLLGRGGVVRIVAGRRRPAGPKPPTLPAPRRRPSRTTRGARAVPDGAPLLTAHGLAKRYGGVAALDGLSLEVPRGQIHAVIGPNGSGKTTLLRVLAGSLSPDEGRITLDGQDISEVAARHRVRLGLARTPALTSVMPELTVGQHVLAGTHVLRRYGGAVRTLAATPLARSESRQMLAHAVVVLELTGLSELKDTRTGELNSADQRLVMLATAFATSPRILLVDEPSSGMSGPDAERAAEVLRRMAGAGTTLVLVEHNLRLVRALADQVTVMDAGRVIAQGTPGQVARRRVVLDAYLGPDQAALISRRSSTSNGPAGGSPGG